MSKVAVVYWSGTGNTEAMANAVAEGIASKGAEAVMLGPSACASAPLNCAEFTGTHTGPLVQ